MSEQATRAVNRIQGDGAFTPEEFAEMVAIIDAEFADTLSELATLRHQYDELKLEAQTVLAGRNEMQAELDRLRTAKEE